MRKLRDFQQLLRDVGFSNNTLRMHLASLERQGFIVKDKKPAKRCGRPVFVYSLPPEIKHQVPCGLDGLLLGVFAFSLRRFP